MQSNTQAASSKPFRSLRERCGFKFTLTLTPPSVKSNQPSYNNVPRRRKRTCIPALNAEPPSSPHSPSSPLPPKPSKLSQLRQLIFRRDEDIPGQMARQGTRNSSVQRTEGDFPPAIVDFADLLATAHTPHFAACDESRCVQEIIPGCYVAFEDDNAAWFGSTSKDSLATPNRGGWTHIVSICQAPVGDSAVCSSAASSDGSDSDTTTSTSSSDAYDEAVQTFRIYLPSVREVEPEDEDLHHTILSDSQLIASRDFLSLHRHALKWEPFSSNMESSFTSSSFTSSTSTSTTYSSSFSSDAPSPTLSVDKPESPPVRLLITTPRNRRADGLSVAFHFLAFTFNCSIETFVRELHFKKQTLSVWRCVLDRNGVQRLDRLLKAPVRGF